PDHSGRVEYLLAAVRAVIAGGLDEPLTGLSARGQPRGMLGRKQELTGETEGFLLQRAQGHMQAAILPRRPAARFLVQLLPYEAAVQELEFRTVARFICGGLQVGNPAVAVIVRRSRDDAKRDGIADAGGAGDLIDHS